MILANRFWSETRNEDEGVVAALRRGRVTAAFLKLHKVAALPRSCSVAVAATELSAKECRYLKTLLESDPESDSPRRGSPSLGDFRGAPRSRAAAGTHRSSRLEITSNLGFQNIPYL